MKLQEKKLNVKSILILTLVLPIVVIALSSIAVVVTAKSASEQQTFDLSAFYADKNAIIEIPENEERAVAFVNELVEKASDSGILKYEEALDIAFSSVDTVDNESVGEIISFAAGSIEEKCRETYELHSIKYGEDASYIKNILPKSQPDSFTAEISDGEITVSLCYTKAHDNMYFLNEDLTAIKMFSLSNTSVFSCINESLVPQGFTYTLTAESESGNIKELTVERKYNYCSHITFVNTLADIGSTELKIQPIVTEKYSFSYAGIEFEQDFLSLTKNSYDTLSVNVFTEDGLSEDEYSLEFVSSDPESVSVDENGQVSFVAISEEPVIIGVKLNYLEREFSDTCTVYAVKQVERVDLDTDKADLTVGESLKLNATVSPNDATVKTVLYFSSDEEVASVGEDGTVTAKKVGSAVIYAVSAESLTAAQCNINVNG